MKLVSPRSVLSALVLALAGASLAASAVVANGVLTSSTSVVVEPPAVSPTGEDLTLEIGSWAWTLGHGGGGEARADSDEPLLIRIVVPSSCQTLVEFIAMPGSGHVIHFEHGRVAAGLQPDRNPPPVPALRETVPTACPLAQLQSQAAGDASSTWLVFLLGSAAVLVLGAGAFLLERRSRPAD